MKISAFLQMECQRNYGNNVPRRNLMIRNPAADLQNLFLQTNEFSAGHITDLLSAMTPLTRSREGCWRRFPAPLKKGYTKENHLTISHCV